MKTLVSNISFTMTLASVLGLALSFVFKVETLGLISGILVPALMGLNIIVNKVNISKK